MTRYCCISESNNSLNTVAASTMVGNALYLSQFVNSFVRVSTNVSSSSSFSVPRSPNLTSDAGFLQSLSLNASKTLPSLGLMLYLSNNLSSLDLKIVGPPMYPFNALLRRSLSNHLV